MDFGLKTKPNGRTNTGIGNCLRTRIGGPSQRPVSVHYTHITVTTPTGYSIFKEQEQQRYEGMSRTGDLSSVSPTGNVFSTQTTGSAFALSLSSSPSVPNTNSYLGKVDFSEMNITDLYQLLNVVATSSEKNVIQEEIHRAKKQQLDSSSSHNNNSVAQKKNFKFGADKSRKDTKHIHQLEEEQKKLSYAKNSHDRNKIEANINAIKINNQKGYEQFRDNELKDNNYKLFINGMTKSDNDFQYKLTLKYKQFSNADSTAEVDKVNSDINSFLDQHIADINKETENDLRQQYESENPFESNNNPQLNQAYLKLRNAKTFNERKAAYDSIIKLQDNGGNSI